MEHNLFVTVNVLEFCKRHGAGLVLLSTSRVYAIDPLAKLPVVARDSAYQLDPTAQLPVGVTALSLVDADSMGVIVSVVVLASAIVLAAGWQLRRAPGRLATVGVGAALSA